MFKTKITEMLGVEFPILGGTMMHITDADFTAAVSNAGGLGVLASAIYRSPEELGRAVDRVRELTDRPFAVNLNMFPAVSPVDNNLYTDVLIDRGVGVVETSGHSAPEGLYRRWKDAGMIWMHKCVGARYARKVESMGADIVTVVGFENGGMTGKLDLGTLVLVPTVVDAVKIPVVGGGGVADGRGVAAILALGAEGVIVGTRLMATREAPLHENVKRALCEANEVDTLLIMRSIGATHRVWANSAATRIAEMESRGANPAEIIAAGTGGKARDMYVDGDLSAYAMACGQGVGLVRDIPPVRELFERMMAEAGRICSALVAR